jgi:hypothetical protein
MSEEGWHRDMANGIRLVDHGRSSWHANMKHLVAAVNIPCGDTVSFYTE